MGGQIVACTTGQHVMATTLGFKRFLATILAAVAAVATALPVKAGGSWMPLLPYQNFYDFQVFAPPDLHEYSIRHGGREGFFFNYDRTYWAFTVPPSRAILNDFFIPVQPLSQYAVAKLNNDLIASGNAGSAVYTFGSDPLTLDLNTNWMRTNMAWGNRFDGGWIYDDYGMIFSYYDTGPQSQDFTTTNEFAVSSPTTTFEQQIEGGGGIIAGQVLVVTTITSESPPPDHVISQELVQRNSTELRSGGFAWMVRRNMSRAGSGQANTMRFSFGPKFLQVADRYSIDYSSSQTPFAAADVPNPYDGPLQSGGWDVSSYNNIVGPEIGFNWEVEQGRWNFATDLRFVAGMNFQNTLYRGSNFPAALGADFFRSTITLADVVAQNANQTNQTSLAAPPQFVQIYGVGQQNATNTAEHEFVFSPLGEWRFGATYRMSKAISLRAGYTGMWLAGITRASTNTEFRADRRPILVARRNNPAAIDAENPNPPPATVPVTPSWGPTPEQSAAEVARLNTAVPIYNRVGPRVGNDLSYLFVNGIDFGIEVNY